MAILRTPPQGTSPVTVPSLPAMRRRSTGQRAANRMAHSRRAVVAVAAGMALGTAAVVELCRHSYVEEGLSSSGRTLRGSTAFVNLAGNDRIRVIGERRGARLHAATVSVNAEPLPDVEEEPDLGELGMKAKKMFQESSGLNEEATLTAEDRVTPFDRWFGFDRGLYNSQFLSGTGYVDPSDEASYLTVTLQKPLGIEFLENTPEEGGGVLVGEVRPGYSAFSNDFIRGGYHLVMANNKPVYGLPFDDAIKPIVDAPDTVKLTFFMGEAQYFYGEYRPSRDWLEDFVKRLQSGSLDDEQ